jgi:hypothetical protein
MKKIEGLVVVHLPDVHQLLCLLRSIDIFVDGVFDKFTIVVQGSEQDYKLIESLLFERDFLKIKNLQILPQSLFISSFGKLNGWQIQQALKLFYTHSSSADAVLVLDAKHVFIKNIYLQDYFLDGLYKMPISSQAVHVGKNRGNAFINCYNFFNLDWSNYINESLPTVTPFIFDTQVVRDLYVFVKKNTGIDFESFFLKNLDFYTEFYFYTAYLHYLKILHSLYTNVNNFNPIFWGGEDDVSDKIKIVFQDSRTQSVGLHRRFIDVHKYSLMKDVIAPYFLSLGIEEFSYWM